jgi:hypothetical protein
MGLLDDAIREHLELKRRHGADPDEVSRQEREALGAPQRSAEFAQPDAEPGEASAGSAAAEDVALDEPETELTPPPEPPDEALEPDDAPTDIEEDPWFPDDAQAEEREPEPGEDVLEETPEFLQETPEHDRLWFEQKPPRGFDWDK